MLDDEELAVIMNGARGRLGPQFASFAQSNTSLPVIEEAIKADRRVQVEMIEDWAAELSIRVETHPQPAVLVQDACFELVQKLRGKQL